MGDRFNRISKDKRNRSSSSLVGGAIGTSRSERKLELGGLIPEIEDHFAQAEARCKDLQDKIELVKALKRKRKLIKKRSLSTFEKVPLISVQTMPKKNATQPQILKPELLDGPMQAYMDLQQHKMTRKHNQTLECQEHAKVPQNTSRVQKRKKNVRRHRAEGDIANGISEASAAGTQYSNDGFSKEDYNFQATNKKSPDERMISNYHRNNNSKEDDDGTISLEVASEYYGAQKTSRKIAHSPGPKTIEERPVVELFNKNKLRTAQTSRKKSPNGKCNNRAWNWNGNQQHTEPGNLENVISQKKPTKETSPHRNFQNRGYEMPTVSSQLKQAGTRFCYSYDPQQPCIPFVPSGSTAPSYNIGVNIQRVLSSVKKQQPLSGIPLTIAHHMGLRHLPYNAMPSHQIKDASLDKEEINLIQAGGQQVRLPSCKSLSFNKILNMYREGDGMVPRFLKAIRSTHYFYPIKHNNPVTATAYDVPSTTDETVIQAGCMSKAKFNHNAKKSLAEYASLYSQYQVLEQSILDGSTDPELERQRYDLANELATREEHIQQVLQEYQSKVNVNATNSREKYSSYKKLNCDQNRISVC